jgi:ribosomal protein S12 methylthiotransferase accessory factor
VWDLIMVTAAVDDLLTLEAAARSAHQTRTSSLYGYMDGLDAVVGLAIPGQTACWNCTRLRLLANTANPEQMHALQASLLRAPAPRRTHTYPAPAPALLGNLLALEGLKLLSGYTPSTLAGKLLAQSIVTLETTLHTVIQMPWCEVCGGAAGRQVGGRGSPPAAGSNGAPDLDAIEDLQELRQRLEGWIDDRTGVIPYASLAPPAPGEPELPFLATAVLTSYTEGGYQPGQQQAGSGKGLTRPAALLGAVGEAVERYSAARYRPEQLHRGLARQLDGEFIEPSALALYHPDQYANPAFPFRPLDLDRPLDWVRGRWLGDGDPVWLPALVALNDFRAPASEYFCQVTSNGLAAGRDLEDAYLRALLELVERDAFMVTWLCRRAGTRLILDSSTDPLQLEVVRQLESCGASIELYLLGTGIDIPVVMCLGTGDGDNWPALTVSLGCHPKPSIAVRRALLEQGQVGPHIRRLMRGAASPVPASPESVVSLTDHAMYYVPPDRLPILDFMRKAAGSTTVADLNEPHDSSLTACLAKVSAAGLRVAGVDVTAPDVRLSPFRVARVVGPWLQPIDFGYKVRRLGNPRVLAMAPEGLNPHPHPLA